MYLGLVSAIPRRIKGPGFPQYCPSHFSYVYSINRDKTLPLYYLAICHSNLMKFNSLIKRFICDIDGKFIFLNLNEFQAFQISEKV